MSNKTPQTQAEKERKMMIFVYGPFGTIFGLVGLLVSQKEYAPSFSFTLGQLLGIILSLTIYFFVSKNWKKKYPKAKYLTIYQLILLVIGVLIFYNLLKLAIGSISFSSVVIPLVFTLVLFCSPLAIFLALIRKNIFKTLYTN